MPATAIRMPAMAAAVIMVPTVLAMGLIMQWTKRLSAPRWIS